MVSTSGCFSLGPKTIDAAIARGHTVTIFNRGKREKYLPLKVAVDARLTWIPSTWLGAHDRGGEDAFPIWNAPVGKNAGFHRWNHDRAEHAGLTFRPIADTVKALLAWYPDEIERRTKVKQELEDDARAKGAPVPSIPDPAALRAGPSAEREAELLAAWKASPAP